jgi:integrase
MRVEIVDFDAATIFTPDGKTKSGRRFIPMSSRVKQLLEARCAGRSEGWVCARHDFGSFILARTGNLKAVMNAMATAT